MVFYETAESELRKTIYDTTIKQIAEYSYKFKQLVSVVNSGAWKNYFFRETLTIPAGKTGNATKGIPRGAEFPQAAVSWERVLSTIEKYGLEDTIPYEDIISNEIDVRDRTLIRIAEGVAKAVDDEIASKLTQSFGTAASDIQSQSYSVGTWTESSAAIVKDIAFAKKKIKDYYNNADKFVLVVSPSMEVYLTSYLYEKGAQAPSIATDAALNGSVGRVAGAEIVVSNAMQDSWALMVVPQRCATWKELMPLSTDVQERRFKDTKITACEMGVTQLTDPKAIVLMKTY